MIRDHDNCLRAIPLVEAPLGKVTGHCTVFTDGKFFSDCVIELCKDFRHVIISGDDKPVESFWARVHVDDLMYNVEHNYIYFKNEKRGNDE